jgi:hypothetical protein
VNKEDPTMSDAQYLVGLLGKCQEALSEPSPESPMDKDLAAKLYAAVLHTIAVLHFERLNTEQRASLANAIVREIELRKIV